ncbi:MAG: glutathione S-transferase family protein [Betaproteobacteria bacterium]|nr:glutathione S-transferase family protein [Betaproteobacteria bacterium]MBV9361148.1 glutathione S-transferase family protein [Betaproteobacteria bacterium]
MLTVHHLGVSQSERIVWLCEELGIPYELKRYQRDPTTRLAPPEYKALHPIGTAPVITDDGVVIGESGAIIEYILGRYGNGKLARHPSHPEYTNYLYWFHYANGSFQALLHRTLVAKRLEPTPDHRILKDLQGRLDRSLALLNERLGEVNYLAGDELTAADIMIFFSFTTMRAFTPFDLKPYPNILAYLKRVGARPAYQRAMKKGDPGMPLLLD